MKNVLILVFLLFATACTNVITDVQPLRQFPPADSRQPSTEEPTPETPPVTTPETEQPEKKILFSASETSTVSDQDNTVINATTLNDAQLWMQSARLTLYEDGTTKFSVKLVSLTPSTVEDLEIVDLDIGNINDWAITDRGYNVTYGFSRYYDLSVDGISRQLLIMVSFDQDSSDGSYSFIRVTAAFQTNTGGWSGRGLELQQH